MALMTMKELVEYTDGEHAAYGPFYNNLRKMRDRITAHIAKHQEKIDALEELREHIGGYIGQE